MVTPFEVGAYRVLCQHVQLKGNTYYYRRRVPEDVRPIYKNLGKGKVNQLFFSLKTTGIQGQPMHRKDAVMRSAIASDRGLLVIFEFHKDFRLLPHAHKDQWGTVLDGAPELTVSGETATYPPGDSYFIAAGAQNGASVTAGTKVIDIFAEPDRYPLKD